MVGYDSTPWSSAVALALSAVASTLAMMIEGSDLKSLASASHVGARLLQSISFFKKKSVSQSVNQSNSTKKKERKKQGERRKDSYVRPHHEAVKATKTA